MTKTEIVKELLALHQILMEKDELIRKANEILDAEPTECFMADAFEWIYDKFEDTENEKPDIYDLFDDSDIDALVGLLKE